MLEMLFLRCAAWGCLGLVLGATTASRAVADTPPASTSGVAAASAGTTEDAGVAGVTSLDVHSDSPEVSAEALRQAVAAELGAEVVLQGSERAALASARVTVSYRPSMRELAVSFASTRHGTVTRVVEAPASPSEVIATAALLAGNLARDQVATPPPPSTPAPVATPSKPPPRPAVFTYVARPAPPPAPYRFGNAAFFYPLATNIDQPELRTNLSFNALYGRVGQLDGFELGSMNAVTGKMSGVELALLGNWVGNAASGLQVATLFNSAGNVEGLQLAGLVNRAGGNGSGGQVAMLANVNGGHFEGLQLSLFNYARDVQGAQLGLINVGAKVKGLQLGLINVADDVEGAPIGLVSVTRSGGVHPMVWGGSASYGNVALKFATRYTYTFLSVALHHEDDATQAGPGLGIGFSVPVVKDHLFFEPDISAQHLFADTQCCVTGFFGARERKKDQSQFKVRAALRYQAAKHFSVFAGGGVVGRLRYRVDPQNDTQLTFRTLLEAFAGVQL